MPELALPIIDLLSLDKFFASVTNNGELLSTYSPWLFGLG